MGLDTQEYTIIAIIQADFSPVPASPADRFAHFDYASFRTTFVRRKRQTSFQRIHEHAERERARAQAEIADACPPADDGAPFWVDFQHRPGIMTVVSAWQQERYHDPATMRLDERGLRVPTSGKVRYTAGLLEQVRNIYAAVEPDAIARIEHEMATWKLASGRTWLYSDEHQALNLSHRYLRECDRRRFQDKNPGFEPLYRADGSLVEEPMCRWIARAMHVGAKTVEALLIAVENVYALRAALDLDTPPVVRAQAKARIRVLDSLRALVDHGAHDADAAA